MIQRLSLLQLVFNFSYFDVKARGWSGLQVGAPGSCRAFVVATLGASSNFLPSTDDLDLGMSAAIASEPSPLNSSLFASRKGFFVSLVLRVYAQGLLSQSPSNPRPTTAAFTPRRYSFGSAREYSGRRGCPVDFASWTAIAWTIAIHKFSLPFKAGIRRIA